MISLHTEHLKPFLHPAHGPKAWPWWAPFWVGPVIECNTHIPRTLRRGTIHRVWVYLRSGGAVYVDVFREYDL